MRKTGPELWAEHAKGFTFINEETGELSEEGELFFEKWNMEAKEKLEAYWHRTINLESERVLAVAKRDAAVRSVKRIDTDLKSVGRLASLLLSKKAECGGDTTIHGTGWGCNLSKKTALVLDKDVDFPLEYIKIREVSSIDKTKIKKALKSGTEIKGAKMETNHIISWMRGGRSEQE